MGSQERDRIAETGDRKGGTHENCSPLTVRLRLLPWLGVIGALYLWFLAQHLITTSTNALAWIRPPPFSFGRRNSLRRVSS